jgi:hypothetical protein
MIALTRASRGVSAKAFALPLPSAVNGGSSRESLNRSACRTRKTRCAGLYSDDPLVDCMVAQPVSELARTVIRTKYLEM